MASAERAQAEELPLGLDSSVRGRRDNGGSGLHRILGFLSAYQPHLPPPPPSPTPNQYRSHQAEWPTFVRNQSTTDFSRLLMNLTTAISPGTRQVPGCEISDEKIR